MKRQTFQHTLQNGLMILGEPRSTNQSCAIGFFVKTGARDENDKESGVSHFLEHMVFKGTERRSALDITYQLGNIGAQANAYTSEESTVYYAGVIPEHLSEMQEILSDMMRPALDQEEFDMEKKVILEEIALYEDRPQFYFFEHALADYFGGHPAGRSVLGTVDSITALERHEMADYFSRRYSANNITLVVTGAFDWDKVVQDAERLCGAWPSFPVTRETSRHVAQPHYREFRKKNVSQSHVLLLTEGCSLQEEERFPLALLSVIMGDSSGSRLYWDLVHTGLAESALTDSDERDGTGCFMAYAVCDESDIEEVAERLKAVVATPLQFTEQDLQRAKTKLATKIALGSELPMGRLMSLGVNWTARGEISDLDEVLAKLRRVSVADVESALHKYQLNSWCEYRLYSE